ncbi:MAG TPA: biotin/lipoyl-containing protein [Anaerolineales bacterium]|nr:biotin/lipoyl-containing protein [Anaerolineales bacterium]
MKYQIRVSDRLYDVEIEDIHARPILALVDGERFEVQPESGDESEVPERVNSPRLVEPLRPSTLQSGSLNELTAPLPGTIIEIFVKAGEQIESGQVVLVIEAMKMKNSIRSTRAARVAEILVNPGQAVAHKQGLVKFE